MYKIKVMWRLVTKYQKQLYAYYSAVLNLILKLTMKKYKRKIASEKYI